MQPAGPTLLGFDVIMVATILSGIATMAVMIAIYAATTVKDPMARRVKALNERREQLKAGIFASTNKRKKLTNRNQAADRVRSILGNFKMLQDDQIKKVQTKLMQAGIRTRDLAFFIIAARFLMPVVLGLTAVVLIYVVDYFPDWSWWRRYMTVAGVLVTTMIQTEKYGTPLASSLRVLSAEFRNERMMRAEEKAARLPAIMTVPLILFILPTLFVVILGPAACAISDNFING